MVWQAGNIWLRRGSPLLLVPAATKDPLPGLGLGDRRLDQGHDFIEISNTVEIELHPCPAETEKVGVALDQARYCKRTAKVDDLGIRSDEAINLAISSDRNQLSAAGGKGGCLGLTGVHGDDPPTHEHQIGRFLGGSAGEQ